MAANTLVVVQGHDHPRLLSRHGRRDGAALDRRRAAGGGRAGAPRRQDALPEPDAPCALALDAEGGGRATFASPQWAPTPGQYVVLYDGDVCLGGGVIVEHAGAVFPAPEPSPA